jgi:hypothetical protein
MGHPRVTVELQGLTFDAFSKAFGNLAAQELNI